MAVVRRLPSSIPIDADRSWSADELRDWSTRALESVEGTDDPAAWCWEEAAKIDGLDTPSATAVVGALERLLELSSRLIRELELGRPDAKHLGIATRWLALSAGLCADAELAESLLEEPPSDPAAERLTVSLMLWGFTGLAHARVGTWLRDRATRLWLARAMSATRSERESIPSLAQPIATVDALLRGYGLSDYRVAFDD